MLAFLSSTPCSFIELIPFFKIILLVTFFSTNYLPSAGGEKSFIRFPHKVYI